MRYGDSYDRALPFIFQYAIELPPEEARQLCELLLEERPDYAARGSSFALTVRPRYKVWLSEASYDRIKDRYPNIECNWR